MEVQVCSVAEARKRLDGGCALLDVREYPEWVEAHLPGARLVPLGELKKQPDLGGAGEMLVLCRSGKRAREAAELLAQHGARPVVIEGGIEAWKQAGFPVRKEGKGPISLERQVRIAAGALVATGILLDLVLPGARYLSLFVGCGLVFAGITNTCAMGLLIAKAPWNRPRKSSAAETKPGTLVAGR